jgi:hypothetical protein
MAGQLKHTKVYISSAHRGPPDLTLEPLNLTAASWQGARAHHHGLACRLGWEVMQPSVTFLCVMLHDELITSGAGDWLPMPRRTERGRRSNRHEIDTPPPFESNTKVIANSTTFLIREQSHTQPLPTAANTSSHLSPVAGPVPPAPTAPSSRTTQSSHISASLAAS